MKEIKINTNFIKLSSLLKLTGFAQTGGNAKLQINQGLVHVNGETCKLKGKKLHNNDVVRFNGIEYIVKVR